MKRLIIDYNPNCMRVALQDGGELIDYAIERASMRGLVGNIYKGKVENVLSGMKAAFINIGLEKNGFLYIGDTLVDSRGLTSRREQSNVSVSAGDTVMCQVVKEGYGGKGARLTTDVTLPGYFLVLLPKSSFIGVSRKIESEERRAYLEAYVKTLCPPNMGFIIRSAANKAADFDIKSEAGKLTELWEKVQQNYYRAEIKSVVFEDAVLLVRAIRDTFSEEVDCVSVNDKYVAERLDGKVGNAEVEFYTGNTNIMTRYGLTDSINHLTDRRVNLPNGGYVIIDKTEALTVIDVNTGRYVGLKDLEDTVFNTNMQAAEIIARQLRVRNLSGIVIIDFIDMTDDEHRAAVIEKLRNELKRDRMKTTVVSMTNLGLVELTRKRTSPPVDGFMLEECEHCMGGFVVSREHLVFMLRDAIIDFTENNDTGKLLVRTSPDVVKTVFELNIMGRELNTIWKGKEIYLYADANLARGKNLISDAALSGVPECAVKLK